MNAVYIFHYEQLLINLQSTFNKHIVLDYINWS